MDEESLPDLERLWQESVQEARKNTQRYRDESDVHAASLIRQIRKRYGPMGYVAIDVLVPLCLGCKRSECRWLETQLPQQAYFQKPGAEIIWKWVFREKMCATLPGH